jgi:hypothetical protein
MAVVMAKSGSVTYSLVDQFRRCRTDCLVSLSEEFPLVLNRTVLIGINELRPKGNIGFAVQNQAAEDSEELAQMLLTDSRADGAGRRSDRLAPSPNQSRSSAPPESSDYARARQTARRQPRRLHW